MQQDLATLMKGRTTIVIARRLATIQRLKRIVVMDQSRILGEGSHEKLVAGGGLYARLAALLVQRGTRPEGLTHARSAVAGSTLGSTPIPHAGPARRLPHPITVLRAAWRAWRRFRNSAR